MASMTRLGLLVLVAACGAPQKSNEASAVVKRATFELQCDRDKLKWTKFDERSYGVSGCGKRATYVATCSNPEIQDSCTWMLNGRVDDEKGGAPGESKPDDTSPKVDDAVPGD